MERIIYDIPMARFIKDYFDKCLIHSLSNDEYPRSNSFYNSSVVIQWIVDLQTGFFTQFLFSQSIHQADSEIIHFQIIITDSRQIEHKFDIKLDIEHTIRRAKLNKIKNKICKL
jgi:hypothetical protein